MESRSVEHREASRRALDLNRKYQQLLEAEAVKIEEALRRNKFLIERNKKAADEESTRVRTLRDSDPLPKFTHPGFFVDQSGDRPSLFRAKDDPAVDILGEVYHFWSTKERKLLRNAVVSFSQATLAASSNPPRYVGSISEEDALAAVIDIDWPSIAKLIPRKTPWECCIRWYIHEHPALNQSEWTGEEEDNLKRIALAHGERDWVSIATELGTQRSALSCFTRYQRSKLTLTRTSWSKEEDQVLRQAVNVYGEKNWQQVASFLENRSGQQCLYRWSKSVHPSIRTGHWSIDEDERLILGVRLYGVKNWVGIRNVVVTRTDVQCRERYSNILDPKVNRSPWTAEEDLKLAAIIKEQGGPGRWTKVAELMEGRTDNYCARRWKVMQKSDYKPPVNGREKRRRRASVKPKSPRKKEEPMKMVTGVDTMPRRGAMSVPGAGEAMGVENAALQNPYTSMAIPRPVPGEMLEPLPLPIVGTFFNEESTMISPDTSEANAMADEVADETSPDPAM